MKKNGRKIEKRIMSKRKNEWKENEKTKIKLNKKKMKERK